MRGAKGSTLQPHQIMRLPRKMNLMIDPHHIWNVIYNAQSNRHHLPTSPNNAPATQKECHDWSFSLMKRHLQCAEQQASPSNLTKHCACHAKGMSWLILLSYETSFTMRGATGITFQPHQILRLPRKMTTQHLTEIFWKQVKRHFQCATDPRMIREWSETVPDPEEKNAKLNPPRRQGYFSHSPGADSQNWNWKLQRFPLRPMISKFHHMLVPAAKSDTWTSPNAAPATKSDTKWHMTTTATTTTTTAAAAADADHCY